jgi:PAS domain S-box-containing protein
MIEFTISNEEFMGLFRRLAAYVANKHPEWVRPDVGDLLESAPDGMVIVNADGKIVVINSQTEILFGYSRQELIGQPVELLIPARLEHLHTKHRASFLAEPHVRPMGAGLELFGKRKNGIEFPVEISLSPLRTPQGLFVTSAIRDISDRKRREEQIKKLNAELGEALRRAERVGATGEQATKMAREIENVLNTRLNLLSQVERQPTADSDIKELVGQAQEEVAHIAYITGNALALQREHETWKKG